VIVWGSPDTWNVRVTGGAAAQVELPDRLAVTEQVPIATGFMLTPETVQIVLLFDWNVTASPEVAVALSDGGDAGMV
jgi:hypothetical protein